jgi:hypothetical protein
MPVMASGSAVAFFGNDGREDIRRHLSKLDLDGSRCRASIAPNRVVAFGDSQVGAPRFFDRDEDGIPIGVSNLGRLQENLLTWRGLKLIVFSPLTAFMPADWTHEDYTELTPCILDGLARDTGAAVVSTIDEEDLQLLSERRPCH